MAEVTESSQDDTDLSQATPTGSRREARAATTASNKTVTKSRRSVMPKRVVTKAAAKKSARSVVIVAMVGGLVATVALPAYAAWQPESEAVTVQQMAAEDAQSLVIASDATDESFSRESYSATTSEEIDKKKAEEAAAERARQLAASVSTAAASVPVSVDLSMVAPGSGEVRWPVSSFTYTDINLFRPPSRPNHNGFDMLAPAGSPIYAAASGTVRVSQESLGGYGVAVVIDSVINGQSVSTLYGHMTYGSRVVSPGQTVTAGQVIGLVGSTGSSTANHLHFEVTINGSLVNPLPWLQSNAG
ncbi:murein DD-endopeptidase MepM/ murein hydrolase activator NlpD [Microbacterium halimionae]|uniref:Murein DD-endopeptidase MepM/ murein hydrolase activator NlpD n=1 Tax=Microbacterium halimionae TaxID=1526413 RepID=A0A7W3PL09_9MICO|nr:M23 family metallopeptidase [Microbacterium halimionae]MBA8815668.1 murein DD-endopeptidase MepM/ murein hydrolase activator NlpD [Microbacterium halimionae]NII95714.1 murein DD-endopeptidase MepM/ murein hydrolase activator NlpD [Microbacterium halimionae]